MRGVLIEAFGEPARLADLPDPQCPDDGVVVRVAATGVCRSDWHAWQGHDPDVGLPHVPGHELAGTVVAAGRAVRRWRVGDLVTVPFVCACGRCSACRSGEHQVCEQQTQPGFTHWGSFAELVALRHADVNLVAVPDGMTPAVAASLGCRFATAYRALGVHARVTPGDAVAVHGCGGVGLSAVMIAAAAGARVVAVDPSPAARAAACELGAVVTLDPTGLSPEEVAAAGSRPRTGPSLRRSTPWATRTPRWPRSWGCAGVGGTSRWACCSPTTPGPRCRWTASSRGSSRSTAATAWRRTSTRRCSPASPRGAGPGAAAGPRRGARRGAGRARGGGDGAPPTDDGRGALRSLAP